MINGVEKIYENSENVKMYFVGFTTDKTRYDFAITYTSMFFGKTLLTCIQTGKSILVDGHDIEDPEQFCRIFDHYDLNEFKTLSDFFKTKIPYSPLTDQY